MVAAKDRSTRTLSDASWDATGKWVALASALCVALLYGQFPTVKPKRCSLLWLQLRICCVYSATLASTISWLRQTFLFFCTSARLRAFAWRSIFQQWWRDMKLAIIVLIKLLAKWQWSVRIAKMICKKYEN